MDTANDASWRSTVSLRTEPLSLLPLKYTLFKNPTRPSCFKSEVWILFLCQTVKHANTRDPPVVVYHSNACILTLKGHFGREKNPALTLEYLLLFEMTHSWVVFADVEYFLDQQWQQKKEKTKIIAPKGSLTGSLRMFLKDKKNSFSTATIW